MSDYHGHKTIRNPDGTLRHEPLSKSEAAELIAKVDADKISRAERMPDEQSALRAMMDAWIRLTELGWKEAMYCPKDGSVFNAIEVGSTGIHECRYLGEWPTGGWFIQDAGDEWPSHPCLFKLKVTP